MNSVLRVSSSSSWAPSQGAKAQAELNTIHCGIKGQEPYSGIIPSTALDLFVSYLDRGRGGKLRLLAVALLVLFLVLFFILGVIPIVILGATTLSVA